MREIINYVKYLFVLPHLFIFYTLRKDVRDLIKQDVNGMNERSKINKSLAFYLVCRRPYRNLFYYRIGGGNFFLRLFLKPYPNFWISNKIEYFGSGAFVLNHPYSTIINAKSIGKKFTVCHLTTIGNAMHGKKELIPKIGNNVSLGANVTIIGDIEIGDNVIVGAGSVVVKSVPSNCIVAGNPARIIKYLK